MADTAEGGGCRRNKRRGTSFPRGLWEVVGKNWRITKLLKTNWVSFYFHQTSASVCKKKKNAAQRRSKGFLFVHHHMSLHLNFTDNWSAGTRNASLRYLCSNRVAPLRKLFERLFLLICNGKLHVDGFFYARKLQTVKLFSSSSDLTCR